VKAVPSGAVRSMEEIPALLREHARTMTLSLRILPHSLRDPLGLAYLLARASDTIADSGRMEPAERVACLEQIRSALAAPPPGKLAPLTLPEELSETERRLIHALPDLFALLGESPDREELTALWREILEGQICDLRRFSPGSEPPDRAELERYCDLVAGSVGRCWTRLIARHAPGTPISPVGELLQLASEYGKGLQLLNILRDREEDRVIGRRYIEEGQVEELLELTRGWLASGERYLRALRPGRILMASALPLDLAKATLPLVAVAPLGVRAKLPRSAVRRILIGSLRSLWLPRRADPV
jgi:farnesyl-diphosphate farnesyltransferase